MENKRPVIVLCPVRNEEDNLRKHIPAWQCFADYIIIADQHSSDNTRAVTSEFKNVIVIDNNDIGWIEGRRNELLIRKAREISHEGVFVYLDADETLSSNLVRSPEWGSFLAQRPGTAGIFEWVYLWYSPFKYLNMGKYIFAFIDDGREVDTRTELHATRGTGTGPFLKEFFFNEIVNLHFSYLNPQTALRKNNWYKSYYAVKGKRSRYFININHNWFYHIKEKNLLSTPDRWLADYTARGIDVTSSAIADLLWYDIEILKWFGQYGERKFFFLDIWRGIDWEQKRKLALARGIRGIPDRPIKKPHALIRFFNGIGTYNFSLFSFLVKVKNRIFRLFLP